MKKNQKQDKREPKAACKKANKKFAWSKRLNAPSWVMGRIDWVARGHWEPLGNDASTFAVGDFTLQHKLVRPGGLESGNEKECKLPVIGAAKGPRAIPLCESGEAELLGPVNLDSVTEKRCKQTHKCL